MDEQELVSDLFRSLLAAVDNEKLSEYPQLSKTLKQAICKKGLSKTSNLSLLAIIEKLASYRAGMSDEYSFRVALKGYYRGEWLQPHSPAVSRSVCAIPYHGRVVVTRVVYIWVNSLLRKFYSYRSVPVVLVVPFCPKDVTVNVARTQFTAEELSNIFLRRSIVSRHTKWLHFCLMLCSCL